MRTNEGLNVLAAALDQAADHVAIVGVSGCIQYVNNPFPVLAGQDGANVVGRHILTVMGEAMDPESSAQLRQSLEGGRVVRCAMLFIDVDHLKAINNTYGFAAGDEVIAELARRIQASVRDVAFVAHVGRLYRDEFSVLLEGLHEAADATKAVARIQSRVGEPIPTKGSDATLTVSMGVVLVDSSYTSAEDVIRDGETAMTQAKRRGGASYQFFAPAIHDAVVRRLKLASDLRHAIANQELVLHYQPFASLSTGRISGVEALVRWQHPRLGFLPPLEFIPVAEEEGLIIPLGAWVLNQACHQLRAWHTGGHDDISISVNVSTRQFRDPGFVKLVSASVRESQIEPEQLKLEITESTTADDPQSAIGILSDLKEYGVGLLLDDFGTGYSSLTFLSRFPFDKLKIDRSFIQQVPGSLHDEAVASTIVAMGRSLGFGLIAEGVETCGQLAFLQALACDELQGHLFSSPVGANDIEQMLASRLTLMTPMQQGCRQGVPSVEIDCESQRHSGCGKTINDYSSPPAFAAVDQSRSAYIRRGTKASCPCSSMTT